jgi:hypothetical protein
MAVIEPLRWFQEEDLPFFMTHPKSLMLYEPRLGKTVLTTNVLARDPKTSSVLIACSKSAMATWMEHIPLWFDHIRGVGNYEIDFRIIRAKGNNAKAMRMKEWLRPRKPNVITVYLVTFNALIFDHPDFPSGLHFDTIIGDEVHRVLRNRTTKSAGIFRTLTKDCRRFHALSGTLAGKWGPGDYWTILNIINRKEHSSYWNWVNTFCIVVDGAFGKEIWGVKNEDVYQRHMSRFSRTRRRSECAPNMPKVVRDMIWVDLSKEQHKMFQELGGKDSYTITEGGNIIVARNSLEKLTRKRQILSCPKILDPSLGYGGAIDDLIERLLEAREEEDVEGQHIVIFSAIRKFFPFIEAALRENGYTNVFTLVGGVEPEELQSITRKFRETKGIILCTTQFAQGFSLDSSTLCYHIVWDYDPNNNTQAEDRLVGQSGTHSINSYYYAYHHTEDDEWAERITLKHNIIRATTATDLQQQIAFKDTYEEWE